MKSDDQFEESFKFVLPGYNVRPLEMSGAIGIEQLKNCQDLFLLEEKMQSIFLINLRTIHTWTCSRKLARVAGLVSHLS